MHGPDESGASPGAAARTSVEPCSGDRDAVRRGGSGDRRRIPVRRGGRRLRRIAVATTGELMLGAGSGGTDGRGDGALHVVALAGQELGPGRRRDRQDLTGRRGRADAASHRGSTCPGGPTDGTSPPASTRTAPSWAVPNTHNQRNGREGQ